MSLRIQTNIEAFDAHRNLVNTENQLSHVDAEAVVGLPDQQGRRRRRRPRDLREAASADRRPRPGPAQRAGRRLARADRRRRDGRGAVDAAARPRPRGRVQQRHAVHAPTRPRSPPRSPSSAPRSRASAPRRAFNGIALLTGSATITFQVGANDGETIAVTGVQLFGSGSSFAVDSRLFNFTRLDDHPSASIDTAIENVSNDRGDLRLRAEPARAHAEQPGHLRGEPVGAASSSIKDVDMASEMVNFTKLQMLQQAGTSVLAQANQSSQSVLTLLRG